MGRAPGMTARPAFARDEPRWLVFAGGLTTVGPPQLRREGTLQAAMNYEPAMQGGYRRTKGYERFDGRPAPSAASYTLVAIAWTAAPAAGTVVAIGAATGTLAAVVSAERTVLVDVSGDIVTGATVMVAGLPAGIVTSAIPSGGVTLVDDATYLGMAADLRRANIAVVPGSGPVRGVASLAGQVYAWRDNVGATAGGMWRAAGGGWTAVSFGEEIVFANANASVGIGDVLTQGAVTATVMAVVVETGTLASGVNTGRLVVSGLAGGNFAAGAATSTGGGTLTLGGAQTAITLNPGGHYRSIVKNFSGTAGADKLYVAYGAGRAFQWDGTTMVPINTGDPADKPVHVGEHLERLLLSIEGSLMWSTAGQPTIFDGITGAQEFAVGALITGFASLPGKAVAIFTDKGGKFLEGAPSSGMELQSLNAEEGALPGAAVYAGDVFALSATGLLSFKASQNYGGFEGNDVAKNFQEAAALVAAKFACASRIDIANSENQVRFMATDGTGLVCLVAGAKVVAATPLSYPVAPFCMWSGPVAGVQRALFGGTDGMVYEIAEVPSFDGVEIEAYFKTNPAPFKSPFVDKTFYDGFLEAAAVRYSSLSCSFEFSSGASAKSSSTPFAFDVNGAGGVWDVNPFDTFYWDSATEAMPKISIRGSGHNLSATFYSKSRYDYGHTLHSFAVRMSMRKNTRMS